MKLKTMDNPTMTNLIQEAAYAHDRNEYGEEVYSEILNQINIWAEDKDTDYSGKTLADVILATLNRLRAKKSGAAAFASAKKHVTDAAVIAVIHDNVARHANIEAGGLALALVLDRLDEPTRALSQYVDCEKALRTGQAGMEGPKFKHVGSTPQEWAQTRRVAEKLWTAVYVKHRATCSECQDRDPEIDFSPAELKSAIAEAFKR